MTDTTDVKFDNIDQQIMDDLISLWEQKLSRNRSEFERIASGVVDLDQQLLKYVEKLESIQLVQDDIENRQRGFLSRVEQIESRHESMGKLIEDVEDVLRNKLPESIAPNALEARALLLNHQLLFLENQIKEAQDSFSDLQKMVHPNELARLLVMVNTHQKTLDKSTEQIEAVRNSWIHPSPDVAKL